MNKIQKIQKEIVHLDFEIFSIKIYINSTYKSIDYNEIYKLHSERNLLKKKLYNLKKQKERVEKLERINHL